MTVGMGRFHRDWGTSLELSIVVTEFVRTMKEEHIQLDGLLLRITVHLNEATTHGFANVCIKEDVYIFVKL